jgi:hypothetical protein
MAPLVADAVLVMHFLLAAFIVLGLPLIWVGAVRRWAWVRNRAFRFAHLAAIVAVAAESLAGIACPLTLWEDALRGTRAYGERGFVERWFGTLLYYDFPAEVFAAAYVGFAALAGWTWYRMPPRCAAGRRS